jgi:hypothetical protein
MLLALKGLPLHAEGLLLQIEGKPIYLMNFGPATSTAPEVFIFCAISLSISLG